MTTAIKRYRAGTLAIGAVALALTLAGCGGAATGSPSASASEPPTAQPAASLYQFDQARVDSSKDQIPFVSSSGPVTIKLSDELKAVVPSGRTAWIDHYTVNAKAFDTGICRWDIDISYLNGSQDALGAKDPADPSFQGTPQSNIVGHLTNSHPDVQVVTGVPSDDQVAKNRIYMTRDFSHLTGVGECSKSAKDGLTLNFLYGEKAHSVGFDAFANVRVAVVAGNQSGSAGSSMIITGTTEATVTATGKWAPPAKTS